MTYNPKTDHNKPPGLMQYITDGAKRRGRGMNSGRTYLVDGERIKLAEVVALAPGSNMSAARRDIVQGVISAQDFVDKYRGLAEAQENKK
jgi:hypothetical protein